MRTIIKSTPVLDADKRLFVQFVTYAADFETKLDDALRAKLAGALHTHITALTVQDKVHLKLYGQGLFTQVDLAALTWGEEELDKADVDLQEKVALLGLGRLSAEMAFRPLDEI